MEFERVLLNVKEVHIFQIPPRQTSKGYKAAEWNENQFLWKGHLKVVVVNKICSIILEDDAGVLFAKTVYDSTTVEPVTDSSRYFVLKLADGQKKAFVGLGFPERNDAFDFNVALQDVKNMNEPQKPVTQAPIVDYSLKEGQSFQINLGGLAKKNNPIPSNNNADPFLPPPSSSTKNDVPKNGWVTF